MGDLGAAGAADPVPIYQRAAGFGFPGIRVDGNDVLASYAVTKAALDNARTGNGPTLIEAYTYRMGAHTTTDDPTRYRVAAELDEWKVKDPISRLRTYLDHNDTAADEEFYAAVDAEADELAAGSGARRRRCRPVADCRSSTTSTSRTRRG